MPHNGLHRCIRSKEYTLRAKCLRHALAEHDAQRTCADDCDDRLFFIIHFLRELLVLCKTRSDACGAGTAVAVKNGRNKRHFPGWEDSVVSIIACRRKGVQQNRRDRGFAVCSKNIENFRNMIFHLVFCAGPCYDVLGFMLRCRLFTGGNGGAHPIAQQNKHQTDAGADSKWKRHRAILFSITFFPCRHTGPAQAPSCQPDGILRFFTARPMWSRPERHAAHPTAGGRPCLRAHNTSAALSAPV